VDGVSSTDGLEVTSESLPPPYEQGLLVVQDGSNTAPRAPQNFKLVPWNEVQRALGLER
jgi:3-phytase